MSDFIPMFTSTRGEAEVMAAYQAVMDQWKVDPQDLTIPTSFGDTHVVASGPEGGPPVVLLHALFATATSWYRNVESLSGFHRVYCVDVIGEANKSRPTRAIQSMDDFLQWFTELLDGLGIDTLYLVGNSYGAFTAAYYAMQLPDRVRKLVLIGPAATIHPMRPFMWHMFIPKAVYILMPWLPGVKRVMRRSVDWMHAGLATDALWEPVFYRTMLYGRLINRVFPRVYTREELAQIQAPVLVIIGGQEKIYGEDVRESVMTLLPGAEFELIAHAHHITALAQPDAVNQRLLRFFDQPTPD